MAFLAETHRVNIAEYTNTGLTALHLAAQNNKVLPFIYLNGKVSLDCVDKDKSTPLHWAAYTKSEQVVAYILSVSTAAIDLQDIEGQTPLMVAVTYGNTRIVRRLLMKGANRYIKNNQHKQALAIAH